MGTIMKVYKFKLDANKSQKAKLHQFINTCRFLYNLAKETKEWAKSNGKTLHFYDLCKQLTSVREEYDWVRECPCNVQQDILLRLHQTFERFYKKKSKYPRWASKHKFNSIVFRDCKIYGRNRIKLSRVGRVKFHAYREIPENAKIKNATVKKEFDGFYICICVEEPAPKVIPAIENQVVGIDWGVARFLTLSTGEFYENPRFTDQHAKELRRLNRSLARKKKYSRNWKLVKKKIAKLQSKNARTRRMWQHKITTQLVRKYSGFVIEDLNIKGMTKSSKGTIENPGKNVAAKSGLNKQILSTAPSQAFRFLQYKSEWQSRYFAKQRPNYSSQTHWKCNQRGERKTQDTFYCPTCDETINADENAAKTLLGWNEMALCAN